MNRLPITGEEFGRYRLLRKLGQGGMGVVFAAHDATLDREVALKLVVPHLAGDEGFRARFQHEAAVLAKLDSPHVVKIFDHGEQDGTLFLVTQLIDGGDLHTLINTEGALSPALATSVLTQVVEGLCDAHAVGVTHRDIKPANVLLRERGRELEAFLCDFGIATTLGADLSRTGTVAGSLPYMAPERHQGDEAGPQGDVYAAGCLLWHALTGTAPYAGTDVEVAMAHLQAPIPQLPGKDDFSRRANQVIAKAMAKDRRKRYPTARALLNDVTALAALAPASISLPGATAIRQPLVAGVRRRRWRPAVVAVVATLSVLGTTAVGWSALRDGSPAASPPADPVTQTVSASAGPSVDARHTLLPKPVVVRTAGELVTVAPAEPLLPPAGVKPPATSRAPAPVRTTPGPLYRCWNGVEKSSLGACSMPTGAAGLAWVFRGGSTGGCTRDSTTGPQRAVLDCPFTKDGKTGHVRLAEYTSVDTAYSSYNNLYDAIGRRWLHAGADWGWMWWGSYSKGYRSTRAHRSGPYIVTVNGPDSTVANAGFARVTWRDPASFRGVRIR